MNSKDFIRSQSSVAPNSLKSQEISIRLAEDQDYQFSHDVTRDNMQEYVRKYWGGWDPDIFKKNYSRRQNFIVRVRAERVGYFAIETLSYAITLHDLQIAGAWQNRGIGGSVLRQIIVLGRSYGCSEMRLRCFLENPALRLYQRHGFVEFGRDGGAVMLAFRLNGVNAKDSQ